MNDSYAECLVRRRIPFYANLINIGMGVVTAVCVLLALSTNIIGMVLLLVSGFFTYLLYRNSRVEYEYLYVDKELTVDKVMAKTRRKRVAAFELDKMEIVAPLKSWHLDNFKNRNDKTVDYSSGVEKQPEVRYVFYYEGSKKVIFEPNEEMIKAMQLVAPRKVFKD